MLSPKKTKKTPLFDKELFKKGISYVESNGFEDPYSAMNPTSSATGKYQFLFDSMSRDNPKLFKGITREQFAKNPHLQERIMDMAIDKGLNRRPSYTKNAIDLTKEYKDKIPNWNYRPDEVAALSHFLGRQGARKYLRSVADGKDFNVPGINKDPNDYLIEYNKTLGQSSRKPKENIEPLTYGDYNPLDSLEPKQMAMGGKKIMNPEYNDLLSTINTGGTHGQNIHGGVPIGKGNSVEQGETMTKDYVFSDRLVLDEKSLKRYNLPKKLKGKTIADASKYLSKINEESNNPIDRKTTEEMLERLKGINEEMRPPEEVSTGGKQFFLGGMMGGGSSAAQGYSLTGTGFMDEKSMKDTAANQTVDGIKDTAAAVTGPWGQLFRGVQKMGVGIGNTVGGDVGAGISDFFSPEESTISVLRDSDANGWQKVGGTVPILGGIISKNLQENRENEMRHKNSLAMNAQYRQMDGGGKRNPLDDYFRVQNPLFTDVSMANPQKEKSPLSSMTGTMFDNDIVLNRYVAPMTDPKANVERPKTRIGEILQGIGDNRDKIGSIANNAMRFSPVLSNYLQYRNMKKPAYEALDRLDSKYRPSYVDETSLVNQVKEQEGTTRRALKEASGGDLGALRNSLLISHLNSLKGRSNAFMQAESINRGENQVGQQFNQRNAMQNIQQSNIENDINQRNIAAYDNNKSRLLSAITENLSNIGLENERKKYPERAGLLYDFLGEYLGKNKE